ncbi:virulence-associated protein [Cardiobacterium hominis]|uniref:virulence-associated protein n=1 Tax=Cardiobacterium hominis TaxID=2718 RepID=UPI00288C62B8|nr:virulence-associated protein [Cardiobacterium hominis]
MSIHADHSGIARGKFTIPANIPAGVKSVEIIGERGSRGLAQFTGRGEITLEERRRVITVTRYDPLAQTITLLTEGRHIAAVGLWFEDIGDKPVTVQIRETATGLPTGAVLAEARITAAQIRGNGEETVVDFATPLYIEALQEFAIVILTDDNKHSLAIAEVGQYDRRAQRYVTEQGYSVGVLLSSSNASTWTPHNNADLAFRLYAAEFTATEHTTELKTQTAHNTSDLYLMADVERPGTETDVSFTFTADDRRYALQDKQTGRLDVRTDGDLTAKVTLRGSKTRSPVLYPGALLALGDLQETATYISRAVVAGSGQAIVTLESNTPSGSALTVEIEIDGTWKSCTPENGEPLGDGWVRNEYKQAISGGDTVRCRITLSGNISARPRARALRMVTT